MGQAKQRGSFEQRKAEAIKAGRTIEQRKKAYRKSKNLQRLAYMYAANLLLTNR